MTKTEFDDLVDLVTSTGLTPSKVLFQSGFSDWHARSNLAKFLCHPAYNRITESICLLTSIVDVSVQNTKDVESKAWSLKQLAFLLRKHVKNFSDALAYINESIALAESIDNDYHTILRGELWGERWIILSSLNKTSLAIQEANSHIHKYASKFTKNNSYLYNAYRFKAQIAGLTGDTAGFLKLMKAALSFIHLNEQEKTQLAASFSAKHSNFHVILRNIDLATPRKIAWVI